MFSGGKFLDELNVDLMKLYYYYYLIANKETMRKEWELKNIGLLK